jgi:integrase
MAHVQRRPGKGWLARYTTPDGKERSRSFTRKVDATNFLATVEVSKGQGAFIDPQLGRITFDVWLERWWPTTVNLRPSSRARDESYLRTHIRPVFGNVPLAKIERMAVRTWVAEMVAAGKAPATVHKAVQVLSKVLRGAVEAGLIVANPAERMQLPRVERDEVKFLTPAEVHALAESIDPRYRCFVLLAASSGLRFGELAGLRRGRVDLMRGSVDVQEILVEVRGHHTWGPPKTRAGRRTVPIPRFVVDELAEHLGNAELGTLVFTAPDGGPLRASLFRRRFFSPAVARAGLGGLTPHGLRHTAVAMWIAVGADPKEIAARAGHTSVVTVLNVYGHLLPKTQDTVTDALEAMARAAAKASRPVASVVALGAGTGPGLRPGLESRLLSDITAGQDGWALQDSNL